LLGDIFDFWFEYTKVVPRGFVLVIAKLRELADSGVKIKYFTGNHDMWIFDYLPKVINAELFRGPQEITIGGKAFYIAHGDEFSKSKKYHLMKSMFANRFFQFLFKWIHPDLGCKIALHCSKSSRKKHIFPKNMDFEKENLVIQARQILEKKHFDFFVFGHRHIPYLYNLDTDFDADADFNDNPNDNLNHNRSGKRKGVSCVTNTGDWLFNFSYAVFDGERLELRKFQTAEK
ncbi:MAG: UDP-2,3-diacylglucosamine diphosphatase, partial [Fibrobacter sp.]|nr:UDP-2,3-diacylglucosamine diphosphatase [Bacteroidales bacterium]MCF0223797.1 UDP-2,3-diacylglucosamine diphosphatase [Fibrobacter sp.]